MKTNAPATDLVPFGGGTLGARILPARYEDNHFSRLPGESKTVNIRFTEKVLAGKSPLVVTEGWKIIPAAVSVE